MRSNCILFAVGLYMRRKGRERYILIRKSRLGSWIPHMLYAERREYGLRIIHFVPFDKRPKNIPPPLFSGSSKWGDLAPTEPSEPGRIDAPGRANQPSTDG